MTVTTGLRETDPNADFRAEACRYHDDRLTAAMKLAAIHATMARSMAEARLSLERFEKFFAALDDRAARSEPAFAGELEALVTDTPLRKRYVALIRDTVDPAVRVRLIALGGEIGWLNPADRRAEQVRMVGDVLMSRADFGDVDLICSLNADGSLDAERVRLQGVALPAGRAADAALACLGDGMRRTRTLEALASRDERDVQIVQAYLRHRPITDGAELRAVAMQVAKMDAVPAQVRALETLARLRIGDAAILDELKALSQRTRSPAVKQAIDEVFLRSERR
jgi:hypothetical protein